MSLLRAKVRRPALPYVVALGAVLALAGYLFATQEQALPLASHPPSKSSPHDDQAELAHVRPASPQAPAAAGVATGMVAKLGHGKAAKTAAVGKKVPKPVATAVDQKQARYVIAESVNIRSAPRADAAVVGRLMRGSMFEVSTTASHDWLKLGEGQYVLAKFMKLMGRQEPSTLRRLAGG